MTDTNLKNFDAQLLNALSRDRWGGLGVFAEELGVPVSIIRERLRDLEKNGVITGYVPHLNDDALGLNVTAIFEVEVSTGALSDITSRLHDDRRMMTVYRVAGDHDLVAIGKYESTTEMNEQVQAFVTSPEIKRTNASVVFETISEFESVGFESTVSAQD